MSKDYLSIIFTKLSNLQKIATEQIKTAPRSKLITFKARESQIANLNA
jgi:hypothetical protein